MTVVWCSLAVATDNWRGCEENCGKCGPPTFDAYGAKTSEDLPKWWKQPADGSDLVRRSDVNARLARVALEAEARGAARVTAAVEGAIRLVSPDHLTPMGARQLRATLTRTGDCAQLCTRVEKP